MPKSNKNSELAITINKLKEVYQDHPSMSRVNVLIEQLKQEKLQDKIFCQSIKKRKAAY